MANNPGISEVVDKNGVTADIEAKRFYGTRTVQMQGDVTATQTWNGDSNTPLTLNASIGAKKVTQDKIADKAVGSGQMADGSVGLTQIAASAMTDSVSANSSKLVTSQGVNAAIAAATLNRGKDYGPMSVEEINDIAETIPTGSTVYVKSLGASDAKVINDGYSDGTMASFSVEVGEDLKYYRSPDNSVHGWYSTEANVKVKQPASYADGIAVDSAQDASSGSAGIEFIQSFKQDTNGNIRDIVKAQVDIVDSTSSTRTNAAATPNAVKSAYDLANTANTGLENKLDKTGDGKDVTATFTEASSRANIGTGEKLSVIFGKIKKWLTDLKALAFKDTVSDSDISGTISDKHIASASTWNGKASGTHTHGNIQNGGTLQTNDITIANGDKLVVTDSSDSSKVARASIAFDGSTTTKSLTPKGTFEAFAKSGDITTAIQALDVSSVGGDGKYISAISETDGKISATATTMDTTPTANSTKAVTSGGIKTALDDKFDKYGFFGNTDGKWIGAALSVGGETEVKYWKLCSFTTGNYWTLNFVADVTNAKYDSNVFERKIIAISGETPGVVESALEIREGNNKLYSTRGYGNIIYYETSGNNVTIYIKAKFAANVGQFCRLVSVLSLHSISNLTWYRETTAGTQPENPVKFSLGYKTVKPAGSTSVPVYIGSTGNPTACTDDFVHDGDVTSTYSSTGTNPVNGKAIAAAIGGLDSSKTSTDGTNVQVKVTETDGKISAVNVTTDSTENRNNKVTAWSETTTDAHYPSEKLVKSSLDGKVDKVEGKGLSTEDYTTAEKTKLASIAAGAEVNQNAFSNVKVGSTTIAADSKTDTLEIAGGTGIDAVGDTTGGKVTLSLNSETQLSLGKADSAVQSVKINGGGELKDASGNVNIPLAVATGSTGAKAGALSADDKKKLNDLGTAASRNVPASGNAGNDEVVLGSDTRLSAGASAVQDVTVDGTSVVNSSKVAVVPNASTSAKGAVQLAGSIGATVASENNKAATEKAVRDAINALDSNKTSTDGTNVQVKVTETDGKISAVNITSDKTENRNNKVSTWQTTPDNTHYPSEKLVKDSLDAKADASTIANDLAAKADKANNLTGATKCKVTYNSQGIVTAGSDLTASDIPNLDASKITSGTFGTNRIADDAITAAKVKANETLPVNVSGRAGSATVANSAQSAYSAKSVDATVDNSITSTGTNGSMKILNGALSSSVGGGGSCSIDGDGISFTKGVGGSSMNADGISTVGTGTFTAGANAKGRAIDGSATFVAYARLTWDSSTTNLVINRAAGSTTTIDLKNLLNGVVYWLHVPRDNIIALRNSSAISTFYCYDKSFTVSKTTDTYDIRSHIKGGSHGGFSSAIVRSNSNFYVMMDY